MTGGDTHRPAGAVRRRRERQGRKRRAVWLCRVDRGERAPRKAVRIGEAVTLDEDGDLAHVAEIPRLLARSPRGVALGATTPDTVLDPDHCLVQRRRGERPAVRRTGLVARSRDPVPAPAIPPVDARSPHSPGSLSDSSCRSSLSPGVPPPGPVSSSRSSSCSCQRSRTNGLAGGLSRSNSSRSPSNGCGCSVSGGPSPGSSPPRAGSAAAPRHGGAGSVPRARRSREAGGEARLPSAVFVVVVARSLRRAPPSPKHWNAPQSPMHSTQLSALQAATRLAYRVGRTFVSGASRTRTGDLWVRYRPCLAGAYSACLSAF